VVRERKQGGEGQGLGLERIKGSPLACLKNKFFVKRHRPGEKVVKKGGSRRKQENARTVLNGTLPRYFVQAAAAAAIGAR